MKSIVDPVISRETAELFKKENYTYPVEYCWIGNEQWDIDILVDIDEDNILDEKQSPSDDLNKWMHLIQNNIYQIK